jgi:transcriptional regulator with XRE-family HTH domain
MVKQNTLQLGQRLREVRKTQKLTQTEFAAELLLNTTTYKRYENGSRIPDADVCASIVEKYRVDPSWLLFGKSTEGKANKYTSPTKLTSNTKTIDVYELANTKHPDSLTMGSPIDTVSVPQSIKHENIVAIIYREPNMSPSINLGAYVGISTDIESTPMGHIYAIWTPSDGTMLFKAYYSKGMSDITLHSDNPNTPDFELSLEQFKQVVRGKVEWVFQSCN